MTQSETSERLNAWVDRQAATVNARALVQSATAGTGRIDAESLVAYGRPQADGYAATSMAPYLCWLSADAMKAKLVAELDDLAADHCSTQKPTARKAALTKAQNELDDLERREEAVIVEAEANGQFIPRRPDVRPEIVLALPETDNA